MSEKDHYKFGMESAHEKTRIRQLEDSAAHWEHKYANARQYNRNLEERCQQLEAALEAAAGLRESDLDGADLYVHRWRQLLAGVTAETPVSTLCAVCDQIKELHPATHAWTAKETWSRFPRAMLDPDFKAETKGEQG